MRNFISSRVAAVPPSGIRKFFDIIATMKEVISLGVGEPDFITPPEIRKAGIASLERGETAYTSNLGLFELREALAIHLAKLYQVNYDPEKEILITVGASEALQDAVIAVLEPGDEVIIPEPCFVSYAPCVIFAGGTPISVATTVQNDFQVTGPDIAAVITPRTKAILLSYPNNPTGAVLSSENIKAIAALAEMHDLVVFSDEVYDRLVYGVTHTCFASLPGMRDRTILMGGFSKAYAMTGWRIGYVCANPEIMNAIRKVHQYAIMCAPTTGQFAALEALRVSEPAVLRMVAEYDRRRQVIVKGFNDIGLPTFEPRGAFYAFPYIAGTGMSSEDFCEGLLVEEKVAIVPGEAFGESGRGYARACYAASMSNIEEAIQRMDRFIKRHALEKVFAK